MNLIEKTNHLGIAIEYVEFESVPVQQVAQVSAELKKHVAAINARQAASPAKAAAAYAGGARHA